jgi:hypothetical protein
MGTSRRSVVRFIEKEIKTYMALSLFLSKKGIKEDGAREGGKSTCQPVILQGENEGSEEACP